MSSENLTTGEPGRSTDGQGCQGRAGQSRQDVGPQSLMSDQRTGGVSGGGGLGRVVRLHSRNEGIELLGFSVVWRQDLKSKRWYPHGEPSAKSQAKVRDKVRAVLEVRTRNQVAVAVVRKVNQITRGWAGAFHYGNSAHVFGQQQTFVRNRLRRWLWRKYSRTHGRFRFFTDDRLAGQSKLWNWPLTAAWQR